MPNPILKLPQVQLTGASDVVTDTSSELFIFSNYLGTINNLAEPIVKTTSSTMKIIYDIVNE